MSISRFRVAGAAGVRRLCVASVVLLTVMLTMQGCYYVQAARGQLDVLRHREPIEEVISNPATPPELAARLATLQAARQFASDELLLPDNDSYTTYADIGRDYVVWNVIAAPEFSLEPETWCYLIVGCAAYRGYFSEDKAVQFARSLRKKGYDTYVGGVAAYSTLGRFDDPILSTMMRRDDVELVGLLFHELAHQRLYIKDDTEFNESFASAVEEIGLERWLSAREQSGALRQWKAHQAMLQSMTALVHRARSDLQTLYASDLPADEMRRKKIERLQALAAEGAALAASGAGSNWLQGELNNARLVSLGLYRGSVAAFMGIYDACNEKLACFYSAVEDLAELPAEQRAAALSTAVVASADK